MSLFEDKFLQSAQNDRFAKIYFENPISKTHRRNSPLEESPFVQKTPAAIVPLPMVNNLSQSFSHSNLSSPNSSSDSDDIMNLMMMSSKPKETITKRAQRRGTKRNSNIPSAENSPVSTLSKSSNLREALKYSASENFAPNNRDNIYRNSFLPSSSLGNVNDTDTNASVNISSYNNNNNTSMSNLSMSNVSNVAMNNSYHNNNNNSLDNNNSTNLSNPPQFPMYYNNMNNNMNNNNPQYSNPYNINNNNSVGYLNNSDFEFNEINPQLGNVPTMNSSSFLGMSPNNSFNY
jgi:hypothetical protein